MPKKYFFIILILLVFTFLLLPIEVLAHGQLIEEKGPGKIRVVFDNGTPAAEVEILLLSEAGEVLKEGETNEEGFFEYDKEIQPYKVVAQDNMGHREEKVLREENQEFLSSLPLWVRVSMGLGFLFGVALASLAYQKKKNVS
ncbi:MAG: hypothetical protein ACOC4G_06745 [Bacillota bacterium]